jgi:prepilin-type N-terminal cleavage/methylation domain-containing protein
MPRKRFSQGFTLIELMVSVAIMGVLSSVAIPAFGRLINRSKTAETSGNLDAMFKNAAAYYTSESAPQGQTSSVAGHCTVDDAVPSPAFPTKFKQRFAGDPSFQALGFSVADYVYYSYGLASGGGVGQCSHGPSDANLYTFFANGDLDGDGIYSTYELAAGSDPSNVMYHSRGFHVIDELE